MSVISLDAHRRIKHCSGMALCLACGHEWMAVYEGDSQVWLECPACRLEMGRNAGAFIPKEFWRCACGCTLFYVSPDGFVCPNCGAEQGF